MEIESVVGQDERETERDGGGGGWLRPSERRWLAALVAVEAFSLLGYFLLTDAAVTSVRYVIYPFVWINVGVLAVLRTAAPTATPRARTVAAVLAGGYFLVLASLAGLIGLELVGHSHAHVQGLQFTMSAPGWGPRLGYAGSVVSVQFIPYRVIGYLALTYLVYATVLDAAGAALSGVLGVGSCIGCSLPVVGSLAAGLAGGTGVVTAMSSLSVDISTAVFVAAVLLLTVRPGVRS